MKSKNGFTLFEITACIVLIAVISLVLGFSINKMINKNTDKEYGRYVDTIKSGATTYVSLNREAIEDLYTNKSFVYVKVGELIDTGLLDENLTNPYTKEKINREDLVKINLDAVSSAVTIIYPVDLEVEENITLITMADILDEDGIFNCMDGAGTYKLALSTEDGTLLHLADSAGNLNGSLISQYDINCKIPSEFVLSTGSRDAYANGSVYRSFKNYALKEGTYEVEYTWRNENGKIHKTTRVVSVKGKKIDVKFNADGGTSNPTYKVVINGAQYGNLASAEKTNYIFGGWYYNGEHIVDTTTVIATESHTLTAKWMKKPTIALQGYNKSGAAMNASNGYVYKDVATVTFYGPERSNDTINYFIRSGEKATTNNDVYSCGTGSVPGVCTSSGTKTINANTWYKIGSGTTNSESKIVVSYENNRDTTTTLETFVSNAKNYSGYGNSAQIRKIDRVNPTACQVVPSGTMGNNGYYVSNVTFAASGTDAASGVASKTVDIYSITTDTKGTAVTATIVDAAGNSTTCSSTYKRDATLPDCYNTSNEVWTNSAVSIEWGCTNDPTSGCVKTKYGTQTYNSESVSTYPLAAYVISDNAGNSRTCPSKTVNIRRDVDPPATPSVTYLGGANTCLWKNNYKLIVSSSDALSGVYKFQVDHDNNGTVDAEYVQSSNSWTWTPGDGYNTHTDRYRTVDYAGNISGWSDAQHIHMTSCTFTITYNANGGSGAPAAESHVCYNSYNLSSTQPTRTGYDFLGWSTSSSATSASYSPGQSYSGNSLYLYAVWKIAYSCPNGGTVTYDSSKGYICVSNNSYLTYTKKDYEKESDCSNCPDTRDCTRIGTQLYTCESGYSPSGTFSDANTTCTKTSEVSAGWGSATKVTTYKCPDGYSPSGTFTDSSTTCTKTGETVSASSCTRNETAKTYKCPDGYSASGTITASTKCKQTSNCPTTATYQWCNSYNYSESTTTVTSTSNPSEPPCEYSHNSTCSYLTSCTNVASKKWRCTNKTVTGCKEYNSCTTSKTPDSSHASGWDYLTCASTTNCGETNSVVATYSYSCDSSCSGSTGSGSNLKCYKCPSGTSWNGSNCTKSSAATKNPEEVSSSYGCTGPVWDGQNTYYESSTNRCYWCSEGKTLNQTTCIKTTEGTKQSAGYSYDCPYGCTKSGEGVYTYCYDPAASCECKKFWSTSPKVTYNQTSCTAYEGTDSKTVCEAETYHCPYGWNEYSGSGSSLNCYQDAKLGA